MTIDEAIEIKLRWRKDNYPPALPDEMNADMLSIEALEAVKRLRGMFGFQADAKLPGETENAKTKTLGYQA